MKAVASVLEKMRPLFEDGGRFARLRPIFLAADNFFFASPGRTKVPPFGRDPLDIKRFMSLVIVALLPSFAAALYFFGWRILLMILVSYVAGGMVEVLFAVVRKEEINEGFLVTGFIFPLILPPGLPLWLVAVGIVFGVLVGKEVFGGTGRNLFNAAIVGRCFIALGYPVLMARGWVAPASGGWGALLPWLRPVPDAVTTATPLVLAKAGQFAAPLDVFLGRTMGSAGETSALAIVLGGVFLLLVGVANWRTVVAILGSFTVLCAVLRASDPASVAPVWFHLFSGGLLFGAFFMATDPVTGPVTRSGKWVYGILIGCLTILIRCFSGYVEGMTFAILLGNICAPLIDEAVVRLRVRTYAIER